MNLKNTNTLDIVEKCATENVKAILPSRVTFALTDDHANKGRQAYMELERLWGVESHGELLMNQWASCGVSFSRNISFEL
jgi:hypothetical protein